MANKITYHCDACGKTIELPRFKLVYRDWIESQKPKAERTYDIPETTQEYIAWLDDETNMTKRKYFIANKDAQNADCEENYNKFIDWSDAIAHPSNIRCDCGNSLKC